ncbi:hypothetical protein GXW82_41025 [Streptacidiphilus sp. 4-A2]|nr:hypothetical protein [Streptacidiphilus sp. 4-A2]
MIAVVDEGGGRLTPAALLGAGTLRRLAFATVLLTGPGVLQMESAAEVPDADRLLTVLAEDLDPELCSALLPLAVEVVARGHVRLLATGRGPARMPGVLDVHCRRDPATGASRLTPAAVVAAATAAVAADPAEALSPGFSSRATRPRVTCSRVNCRRWSGPLP